MDIKTLKEFVNKNFNIKKDTKFVELGEKEQNLIKAFASDEQIEADGKSYDLEDVVFGKNTENLKVDLTEQIKKEVDEAVKSDKSYVGDIKVKSIFDDNRKVATKNFSSDAKAYAFGQWFKSINGDMQSKQWCVDNGIITKAQSTTTTAGGYLVPSTVSSDLITLRDKYGIARTNARYINMPSDVVYVPIDDSDQSVGFIAENTGETATDKAFDRATLTAAKVMGLTYISSELLQGSVIGIADNVAQSMARKFAYLEDYTLFKGDGTATYGSFTGVINAIEAVDSNAGIYQATGHDEFDEITLADFAAFMALLPDYAWADAKWYCSNAFWASVMLRLEAAAGGNSMQSLSAGAGKMFLGYPVVTSEILPKTSTADASADDTVCLFGDLASSVIFGEREGFEIATSDVGGNAFTYDELAVRCKERIAVSCFNPGTSSAAGGIVAMQI